MASEHAIRLGATVRSLRESLGITQLSLAKTLGCHQTNIGRIENGEAEPSLGRLVSFAEYFGVSVSALLDGTAAPAVPKVEITSSVTCSDHGIVGSGLTAAKAREVRTAHMSEHLNAKDS